MNTTKNWLVLGCLAAIAALALALAFRRTERNDPGGRDISGGAKIQRQRIDRTIATVGSMDIAQTLSSLGEYNQSFELAGLAGMSPSSFGYLFMNQILADRRLSRVFEHLMALNPKEAEAKANDVFRKQFDQFNQTWQRFAQSRQHINTGPKHHAASIGLILCSYFCSPQILDTNIKLWTDAMNRSEIDEIEGVQYVASRFIDPLFHLNVLMISGSRNGASIEALDKELDILSRKITGGSKPFLKVSKMKMFKWNAETLDTDFTHRTRGVPASGNSVLLELPGFANPNSALHLQNRDVAEQLLNCVRAWRDRR